MTQSNQPGLPPDSDALPNPVNSHERDLDAVVAGGVNQPSSNKVSDHHEWYRWPFTAEVWIIAISVIALCVATLLFGGAGFAVVFWATVIFWLGYGLIYKVMLNG